MPCSLEATSQEDSATKLVDIGKHLGVKRDRKLQRNRVATPWRLASLIWHCTPKKDGDEMSLLFIEALPLYGTETHTTTRWSG